jgi:hypothetical protein
MRHFPWRELGYAVGFLTLLAVLYVGSYYATVERQPIGVKWWPETSENPRTTYLLDYRLGGGGGWAHDLFGPMHRLDKMIRPDYWDGNITVPLVPIRE